MDRTGQGRAGSGRARRQDWAGGRIRQDKIDQDSRAGPNRAYTGRVGWG